MIYSLSDMDTPSRSTWDDDDNSKRSSKSTWDMPPPMTPSQRSVRSHRGERSDRSERNYRGSERRNERFVSHPRRDYS